MGGYGSTRWNYHYRKITVEETQGFNIKTLPFREYIEAEAPHGRFYHWTCNGKHSGQMAVYFYPSDSLITFVYDVVIDGKIDEKIKEKIKVSKSALHFGGYQYFLHCPQCNSRVKALYRPLHKRRFACRQCHNLSYRSAQEAHQFDRGRYMHFYKLYSLEDKINLEFKKLKYKRLASRTYKRIFAKITKLRLLLESSLAKGTKPLPRKLLKLLEH